MHVYNATELFDLHISGCFPLDIDFKSKSIPAELNASGNYLLFFDKELIYCGFAEKERAIVRFEKQLATISLRGVNVSFNETGKKYFTTTFLNTIYSTALKQNEKGFETSIKRIIFAEKNWQYFRDFDNKTLERFVFVWMPSNNNLSEIKTELIQKLKPICNG
jgi:hypothetical protein